MRSLLDVSPPSPPPPLKTLAPPPSPSYLPSILIITAVIVLVLIVSAAVHFLLRHLSRQRSPPPPQAAAAVAAPAVAAPAAPVPPKDTIASLPLFSLKAALPRTGADCAVCLSAFQPHDELRMLPACRHAFHAGCIDTWLRSTSSCPLCRAAVVLPFPPIAAPLAQPDSSRSGSFRIEIGSVSRRRSQPEAAEAAAAADLPSLRRSYSLGSSFEYVVEEEVEAILDRVLQRMPAKEKAPPPPPEAASAASAEALSEAAAAEALAEAAGGGSRGWLREYVDRLSSSSSLRLSSSSFRRSARSSQRYDGSAAADGGDWGFEGEEGGMFSNFSRWLWGPQA